MALGHNAPCVIDAVRAALDAGEPAMVQPYRAPHAVALASGSGGWLPATVAWVFTTSGAEAVEAAIKLVRARTRRPIILSAHGSFHGKTLGALAATGQRSTPRASARSARLRAGSVRRRRGACRAARQRRRRIAALFLEPIQGERGVHLPPPGYLRACASLCTPHGVALVLDEVQTGLGRTGRLFACEHEGVAPDVLLVGQGARRRPVPPRRLPRVGACWDERFALRHSSTFANNNVACRVGLAVLDALTRGGLCAEAARKGKRLLARLEQLAERYPSHRCGPRPRPHDRHRAPTAWREEGAFLSFLDHQGLYAYAVAATVAENAGVLVLPTLGERPCSAWRRRWSSRTWSSTWPSTGSSRLPRLDRGATRPSRARSARSTSLEPPFGPQ